MNRQEKIIDRLEKATGNEVFCDVMCRFPYELYEEQLTEVCERCPLNNTLDQIVDDIRWIPCSQRLPKANGRYFVTRGLNACGAIWKRTYIVNYSDLMGLNSERIWWDGNVGKSDFERIDDVIAWMPLPEPYKVESEG